MRSPTTKSSRVIKSDPNELDSRAKIAEKLGGNAPLQYSAEKKRVIPKNTEPVAKATGPSVDLLSSLISSSEYSKNNKERKTYNINLNKYEKAALYVLAKSQEKSMQQYIQEAFISQVLKDAEKLGLNEETVVEIYKQRLIK
ncbi:hypothetical protein [Thalassotalea piscium]|uniref:Uncharacterized protein n=1 Tax=Thalassotalea piscium TaxID=1230533 RepID=A0A7X0NGU4_9GAMM|nr:hypothetical protein [Thalassotalea piscium]MBB6543051.1 hypothetical protein [Thalassotalea piscium]